jgi:hypothetical protein
MFIYSMYEYIDGFIQCVQFIFIFLKLMCLIFEYVIFSL